MGKLAGMTAIGLGQVEYLISPNHINSIGNFLKCVQIVPKIVLYNPTYILVRAMAAVLFTGAAQHHKANPSATIQLEKLYGCPVLIFRLGLLSSEQF